MCHQEQIADEPPTQETAYQCGQCSVTMDSLEAAMQHVQTHQQQATWDSGVIEEAPPAQAPPTSFSLAEQTGGAELADVNQADAAGTQQIQVEDEDGNHTYITVNVSF